MRENTVSVARMASALQIGARLVKEISKSNNALLTDGMIDAAKLFAALTIPSGSLIDLHASRPVLLTAKDLAMRSGLCMRTIRSYAADLNRPPRFPRAIFLSPHHRHFLVADLAAYEFGVSDVVTADTASEYTDETADNANVCGTAEACFSSIPADLDAIIPDPPRKKQVRKK